MKPPPKEDRMRNLSLVFGEFGNLYELFLPSVRNFPTNGIIWEEEAQDQHDFEKEQLIEERV